MPGKGRPFKKGQSGNPSGLGRAHSDVVALARTYTVPAVHRLAYWLESKNASASVAAASILLDRGWGKPAQALTGPQGAPLLPTIVVHRERRELLPPQD